MSTVCKSEFLYGEISAIMYHDILSKRQIFYFFLLTNFVDLVGYFSRIQVESARKSEKTAGEKLDARKAMKHLEMPRTYKS